MTKKNDSSERFTDFSIDKQIVSTLDKSGITSPTPIQSQAIPELLKGEDVMGIAQTGTGKTLAFVIPLLQYLLTTKTRALIVLPTRELAMQVHEVLQGFSHIDGVSSAVLVGGMNIERQIRALKKKPRIFVGTPGRINDHIERRTLKLGDVHFLVLDEADRMFDMGFAPQLDKIFAVMPKKDQRQTALFSATMPKTIIGLAQQQMKAPVHIEIASSGTTAKNVKQEMIVIDQEHRNDALFTVLKEAGKRTPTIVFTRTKRQASKLYYDLKKQGYRVSELHGDRSQNQRKRAIQGMQEKKIDVLVATDVAARGLDISHLELVVNYALPDDPEDYVHRIGRTGRAGKSGKAISLVMSDQLNEIRTIQKLIDKDIEHVEIEGVPTADLKSGGGKGKKRSYRGRGRGSSGGSRSGGGGSRGRSFGGGRRSGGGPRNSNNNKRRSPGGRKRRR